MVLEVRPHTFLKDKRYNTPHHPKRYFLHYRRDTLRPHQENRNHFGIAPVSRFYKSSLVYCNIENNIRLMHLIKIMKVKRRMPKSYLKSN